jgi:hypothetical protein
MANIIYRQANVILSPGATIKGSPLTNAEVDNNFANLNVVVGFRENLTTTAKDNLVAAVNEVRFDLNNLSQSSIKNGTSNVNIATSNGPIEISSNLLPINNEFLSLGSITKGFLSTFYANSLSISQSFTTSGTGQQAAFTFNASNFRSGEYFVQMISGSNVHITKIHLTHNTTHAFISQFGDVVTNASVGTFDADISGGNARLLVTPVVSGTIVKTHATLIKS